MSLARTPDAYEAAYMGANENVLERDQISFHPVFHVLLLMAVLVGAGSVIVTGGPLAAALAPIFAGILGSCRRRPHLGAIGG